MAGILSVVPPGSEFDDSIPQNVMNAYIVLTGGSLTMLAAHEPITHIFVCGGVGSIAAAIFQGFYRHYQDSKKAPIPRFIAVESSVADCLYQSAKNGEPRLSTGDLRTVMVGLACRGPSPAV